MKAKVKRFGICFKCGNVMRRRVLEQIEFYEGHIHIGCYHHKLMCPVCEIKADELTEAIEKGLYIKREHFKDSNSGGKNGRKKEEHHI